MTKKWTTLFDNTSQIRSKALTAPDCLHATPWPYRAHGQMIVLQRATWRCTIHSSMRMAGVEALPYDVFNWRLEMALSAWEPHSIQPSPAHIKKGYSAGFEVLLGPSHPEFLPPCLEEE